MVSRVATEGSAVSRRPHWSPCAVFCLFWEGFLDFSALAVSYLPLTATSPDPPGLPSKALATFVSTSTLPTGEYQCLLRVL